MQASHLRLPMVLWPAWLLLPSSPALASEPLLVVVESTADAAASPEEIRADVAVELGCPVLGPTDLEGGTNAEALIVNVDARTAILAFQPSTGAIRRRKIDLPADAPGRRKTIAWLAQNLVKDQVAGLPEAATDQTRPSAPVTAPPAPSPLEPPPPASPPPAHPDVDFPAVATKAPPAEESLSRWRLAVSGGPSLHVMGFNWDWWAPRRGGNEWQIEAQRSMGTWSAGLALDLGEYDTPLAGLAGFIGDGWQRGTWSIEGTAGLGLELTTRFVHTSRQTMDSQTGTYAVSELSTELRPRLYGRGNLTLAWRGLRSVDFMLRSSLHVETDDQAYSYGSALLGLRMNLP